MKNSFVIMAPWLQNIEMLPEEQKKEIYYRLIRYGIYEEEFASEDPAVAIAANFILPQISKMQTNYEEKKELGKKGGRKATYSNDEVYQLAVQGLTGAQIGEQLGVPAKTIYSSQGWKKFKSGVIVKEETEFEF